MRMFVQWSCSNFMRQCHSKHTCVIIIIMHLFYAANLMLPTAKKKKYTGWPKKVSHYQIIKKSY